MKRNGARRVLASAGMSLAVALAASGCAPDSGPAAVSADAPGAVVATTVAESPDRFPDIALYELGKAAVETTANLRDIFPAAKPVVMWFWAPY